MRTGIYVYASTTLTIQASEPIMLTSLDNRSISFAGGTVSTEVPAGIYKAVTNAAIAVSSETGPRVDVVIIANNKDPWPDPPLAVVTAFNVTTTNLNSFFAIPDAKSAAF